MLFARFGPTSPGRFAIMTGRNPFRTGLQSLGAMRPQEVTIAQLLKKLGYATGHFGKWHLGEESIPTLIGFNVAVQLASLPLFLLAARRSTSR